MEQFDEKAAEEYKSVLPGVRMFCSLKSQASFRRAFHKKLTQTMSRIESPELRNLKRM